MKKIIKKFWGVAFVLVLLSTLLVGAIPQASAGILTYTWATLPSDFFSGIISAGTQVLDFAIANDGKTIYAATTSAIARGEKSLDGGRSWIPLTSLRLVNTHMVAVAPDNANIVAYMDVGTANVSVSLDGGNTFTNLGQVQNLAGLVAGNVTDIDISSGVGNIHYIAVSGCNGTLDRGALYYFNLGGVNTGWRNAVTDLPIAGANYTAGQVAGNTTIFNTVKFSPAFSSDYIAYIIGSNGTTTASMHVLSFNSYRFDAGVPGFQGYDQAAGNLGGTPLGATDPTTGVITPSVFGGNITKAQIVFDATYSGLVAESRTAYVSVACGGLVDRGDIFRFTDNGNPVVNRVAPFTMPTLGVWSIALKADSSILVAAAARSNYVWTIASPASPVFAAATVNRIVKRVGVWTGTDNQTVAYSGSDVLLAKSNTEGAFSRSTDNGYTFNDISLVNTALSQIVDTVVCDGPERYVISNDDVGAGGHTSVFYFDGAFWERVLTIGINGAIPSAGGGLGAVGGNTSYVVKAAPLDIKVLYIGDTINANVYYTATAGKVNWQTRTSPIPGSALVDLEVQDEATLYVATNVVNPNFVGGLVSKLTVTGQIWAPASVAEATATFLGGQNIASITLVSAENLVAGSVAGWVAYSTNGAASWFPVSFAAVTGVAGPAYATATSVGFGSTIYATESNSNLVFAWTIGTSTTWGNAIFTAPATSLSTDIEIYNGALYRIGTNGTDMTLSRAFVADATLPLGTGWASTNISPQLAIWGPSFPSTARPNVIPDVLKFNNGNQVWFVDSLGADRVWGGFAPPTDQIITYTDTLVAAKPAPTSPANGVLIEVNKETGIAYQANLTWDQASAATQYQLQIAYNNTFTQFVAGFGAGAGAFLINFIPIPGLSVNQVIGPPAFNYQPGETYYWRVRATAPYFSQWSSTYSITIQPAPAPVPELFSPINGEAVATLTPGFSWSQMGAATEYSFALAKDAYFNELVYSTTIEASDGAGISLPADIVLEDGVQYFWKVQESAPVAGSWSTVGNFIVDLPDEPVPPVEIIQQPAPILEESPDEVINPSYIWAIIIIGAVLVIAIIVLIFRTRQT